MKNLKFLLNLLHLGPTGLQLTAQLLRLASHFTQGLVLLLILGQELLFQANLSVQLRFQCVPLTLEQFATGTGRELLENVGWISFGFFSNFLPVDLRVHPARRGMSFQLMRRHFGAILPFLTKIN